MQSLSYAWRDLLTGLQICDLGLENLSDLYRSNCKVEQGQRFLDVALLPKIGISTES